MKEVIGIDLGGTRIRAGLIKEEKLLAEKTSLTPKTDDQEVVIEAIVETIKQIITSSTEAIGIGIPSVVDTEKGIVYDVMNIPSWKEVHLKAILESEFNIPVHVNNDANCFAMGERIYGEGKDFENFVGLTLGTGLGAGIIQQGHLLQDANCGSGRFCVVPYKKADYESYCSGMFFQRLGKNEQDLYKKAINGDKHALKLFGDFGFHVAQLVKMVVATIDPQMIIFGGSVGSAYPFFEDEMLKEIQNFAYPNSIKNLEIKVSKIETPAIFGAAALCY